MSSIGDIEVFGCSRSLLYPRYATMRAKRIFDEYLRRCDEDMVMNLKKTLGAHRSLCRNLFGSGKCSVKGGRCDSDCGYMKEFINKLNK